MTLHDTIVIIAALVNLIAFGGFAYWIKGSLQAQQQTITALKNLIDALDTPKMLERFEAFKKTVDLAKEAAIQDLERKFEEERKELVRAGVETTSELADDFLALIVNLMP